MAQFARPDSDSHVGNWEDEGAATTNLFQSIDESSSSDADYVTSEAAPSTSPYVAGLSSVTDPLASSGHIVRYRYSKDTSGATIDLVVQLREGYISEASQGTLIATTTHSNIGTSWTAGSFTLSSGEANSITDYADLHIRWTANQV